ncbi:hypothetical protein JX265_011940 [Neoarthrinium moseri]|uniref:Uncharacterized protein n=1 Tax=Neoarthrinium moseri TaxID=1658444 RepID=A0A9P9WB93_9PEZI|nr:uncharacterized protein JN550_008922 [Neoarthrinium moseri]KAI1846379.1 hypothetical protein JX266_007584 [Neoarthrinium moseri]KAI1856043.1 hypothetical protein JX265_011940 [Neoarthrinium moseri]KAI1864365.1 hypothetical protein JN550_008922 [Neoarthrinium moseri]
MKLSAFVIGALAFTVSALPSSSNNERRSFSYHSTVSDPGFYAVSFPPDYHENQILQWLSLPTSDKTSALVARFPAGFSVTQSGPAKINVYTRTSGGIGTYVGTVGPLSVKNGLVTKAVDVVVATFPAKDSFTFEFQVDSETENASIQFFENDKAGFFIRTGSS